MIEVGDLVRFKNIYLTGIGKATNWKSLVSHRGKQRIAKVVAVPHEYKVRIQCDFDKWKTESSRVVELDITQIWPHNGKEAAVVISTEFLVLHRKGKKTKKLPRKRELKIAEPGRILDLG